MIFVVFDKKMRIGFSEHRFVWVNFLNCNIDLAFYVWYGFFLDVELHYNYFFPRYVIWLARITVR